MDYAQGPQCVLFTCERGEPLVGVVPAKQLTTRALPNLGDLGPLLATLRKTIWASPGIPIPSACWNSFPGSALYSRAYTGKPMISVEEEEKQKTTQCTDVWGDRWGPPLFRGRTQMQTVARPKPLESKAHSVDAMAKEAIPNTASRKGNCVDAAWDFNKAYFGGKSSAVAESDFFDLLDGSSLELTLTNLPCLSEEEEEEEKKDDEVATAVAVTKPLPAHATITVTAFGNHDVESALGELKEAAPQPQAASYLTSMFSSVLKGCNATVFGNHVDDECALEELKEAAPQPQAASYHTSMFSSVLKGCNAAAFGNHGDVESAMEELKEAAPHPQAASSRTSMFSSVLKGRNAVASWTSQPVELWLVTKFKVKHSALWQLRYGHEDMMMEV
eukprot:gene10330-8265_t